MAGARYFIRAAEGEKGPYTVAQLREAVEQTAISPSIEVRRDGKEKVEPLAALLRRTEPDIRRALRERKPGLVAGVDLDADEGPTSERSRRAIEGSYDMGLAIGFFGGLVALALSFRAKPRTREGIRVGFLAQLVIGFLFRLIFAIGSG